MHKLKHVVTLCCAFAAGRSALALHQASNYVVAPPWLLAGGRNDHCGFGPEINGGKIFVAARKSVASESKSPVIER